MAHPNHKSGNEAWVHARTTSLHVPKPHLQIYGGQSTQSLRHTFTFTVFVINHIATPRTSCFLWHLPFDKLKLTDTAERFITLYCFVYSLVYILRNMKTRPLCRNFICYSTLVRESIQSLHPWSSSAFECQTIFVWKAKQTHLRHNLIFFKDEFPSLGKTALICFDAIPMPECLLLCKWIKLMHLSLPCWWALFISLVCICIA